MNPDRDYEERPVDPMYGPPIRMQRYPRDDVWKGPLYFVGIVVIGGLSFRWIDRSFPWIREFIDRAESAIFPFVISGWLVVMVPIAIFSAWGIFRAWRQWRKEIPRPKDFLGMNMARKDILWLLIAGSLWISLWVGLVLYFNE